MDWEGGMYVKEYHEVCTVAIEGLRGRKCWERERVEMGGDVSYLSLPAFTEFNLS